MGGSGRQWSVIAIPTNQTKLGLPDSAPLDAQPEEVHFYSN